MIDYSKLTNAELDALVATSVMGWHVFCMGPCEWEYDTADGKWAHVLAFSPSDGDSPEDLILVLRKVLADGCQVCVKIIGGKYAVRVARGGDPWKLSESDTPALPRALCLAVNAAYEVKHD